MIDSGSSYRLSGRVWDMARQRQGRSLVEDVYEALRADILLGRRLPGSRIPLRNFAEEHNVSLSVVREAVTRSVLEDFVEAIPQRGFRVRSLSLSDLRDLTWVRIQIETLALRESIVAGDVNGRPTSSRPTTGSPAPPPTSRTARRTWAGWPCTARITPRCAPLLAAPPSSGSAASCSTRPNSTGTGRRRCQLVPSGATLLRSIARSARPRWPATPTGPSADGCSPRRHCPPARGRHVGGRAARGCGASSAQGLAGSSALPQSALASIRWSSWISAWVRFAHWVAWNCCSFGVTASNRSRPAGVARTSTPRRSAGLGSRSTRPAFSRRSRSLVVSDALLSRPSDTALTGMPMSALSARQRVQGPRTAGG